MLSSSSISMHKTPSPVTGKSAIDLMWAFQCPACVLMTFLGKTVFPSFGRALLMLLISLSCLVMQVAALFPPEISACMCRTPLLTKFSTWFFQVLLVMLASSSNNLSNSSALVEQCEARQRRKAEWGTHTWKYMRKSFLLVEAVVGVITFQHKIACLQHRLYNLNINFCDLFLSWALKHFRHFIQDGQQSSHSMGCCLVKVCS